MTYKETPEAFIKRAIDDLSDVESNLFSALNSIQTHHGNNGSFYLKKADSLLKYLRENVQAALIIATQGKIRIYERTKPSKGRKNV
jgi:hypothetical protein